MQSYRLAVSPVGRPPICRWADGMRAGSSVEAVGDFRRWNYSLMDCTSERPRSFIGHDGGVHADCATSLLGELCEWPNPMSVVSARLVGGFLRGV